MRKKLTVFLALFLAFFGATLILLKGYATPKGFFKDNSYTLYSYDSTKIDELTPLSSSSTITEESLQEEDRFVSDFLTQKEASFLEKMRVYTYLYVAQREFALLSFAVKHHFEGDLRFLTERILKMFYPDFSSSQKSNDTYSQKLTEIVFARLEKRYEEEKKLPNNYPTDQWIPWVAKPSIQFFPAPYDRNDLNANVQEVVRIQKHALPVEKQEALYWEGGHGSDSGDWITIGNKLLFEADRNIPLGKIILIRNLLSMTFYDTEIAVLEAKYHFRIPRPYEVNPEIIPLGPRSLSPSYPSGHAALAGAASTLLIHFLPEDKIALAKLREDASYSRLIAGVHTTVDLEEGRKVGEKIAQEVLFHEWDVKEKEHVTEKIAAKGTIRSLGKKYPQAVKCCSSRQAILQFFP